MADGSIRVNVELANNHLKAGLKEIENMISNSSKGIKKSLEQIDNSTDLKNMTSNIKKGISDVGKDIASLQNQLDNINSNKSVKAVQKMIDTANKEIDKAKNKIDEYQKKLNSIVKDKQVMEGKATDPIVNAAKMNNWSDEDYDRMLNRALDNLSENKDYQKLISQEKELNSQIESYSQSVSVAESKVKILNDTLANTKENMSADLSSEIEKSSQDMEVLNDKYSQTVQLQEEINQVNSSLKDEQFLSRIKNEEQYNQLLQETLSKMSLIESESERAANLNGMNYDDLIQGNEQYQQMYHQLTILINNQDRFTQSATSSSIVLNALKEKFPGISSKLQKIVSIVNTVKEVMGTMGDKLKPVAQKIISIKDKIKSLIPHFNKAKTSSKGFGDGVANSAERGIKKLAKMGLAVLGLRSAFMGVRKAINMALEGNKKAQDIIATFWNGISKLIQPVITTVVNGLGTIMSYINSIYKTFTGKDLFKAVSSSSKKAADSTKKIADNAKEAKRQLAGFDEMQVLSGDDKSDKNSGTGTPAYSVETFDVSGIKTKLLELFEPLKNAWSKYGKGFTDSFKDALNNIWELVKSIGKSFETVWLNGTGEETCSLILEILTNIFDIIGSLASKFKEAWDKAGVGTSIIQNLWDIFNNLLKVIESITKGIKKLIDKTDFTPFLEGIKIVTGLFKDLSDICAEFWENTIKNIIDGDFSSAGENLSTAISNSFNTVTDFIKKINWLSIGKDIGKFLADGIGHLAEYISGIKWGDIAKSIINFLGEAIGALGNLFLGFFSGLFDGLIKYDWLSIGTNIVKGIIEGIKTIGSAIVNLFNSAVKAVKNFLGIHSPSTVFMEIGKNILAGVVEALKGIVKWFGDLFSKALNAVKSVFSLKTIKNFFSSIWNGIKSVFNSTKSWFGSLFSGAWSKVKGAFSLKTIKNFFSGIWNGIKSAFGSVASWFKDVFSKAWTAVKKVFSAGGKVFSGIKDGIANVFKSVVNILISGINKVIAIPFNAINKMLNTIRSTDILGFKPFVDLWKKNPLAVPQIPKLARGGIVNVPTQFIAGEAGAEAILPLQNNLQWMDDLAEKVVEKMDIKNNQGNTTIILKVGDQEFYRWLINMKKKNSLMMNGG